REVQLVAGAVGSADHHQPDVGSLAPQSRQRFQQVLYAAGEVELAEVADQRRVPQPELPADGAGRAARIGGDIRSYRKPADWFRAPRDPLERDEVAWVVARQDCAAAE